MHALKGHSKFFLDLTGVYGAVSGVGIWFSIGLASPEGTSTLIHNFVFGWAIEWTFFIVEVTAAVVYYYTWGRISDRLHLTLGWIYAISAWFSLVIINGILTFMLTPGPGWLSVAGTGNEATMFWHAFFNPTYWPSLFVRTLICISLAGVWALLTSSRLDGYEQPELKADVVRWSCKWLLPSFLLLPAFILWYLYMVPEGRRELLQLGIGTIGQGVFTQVTRAVLVSVMASATIAVIAYFLAYRDPRNFGFGHALGVLLLALTATASTEHAREMLRKPYVIADHMYSNGIRKSEVEKFNTEGYLTHSPWATAQDRETWAQIDASAASLALAADAESPELEAAQRNRGELMLRGQCLACHTRDAYRSFKRLLAERDRESIGNILTMLHDYKDDSPYRAYMPPLVGTKGEIDALGDYLAHLVQKKATESGPKSERVAKITQPK
jgi:mono/diheme cytochrome c family protein